MFAGGVPAEGRWLRHVAVSASVGWQPLPRAHAPAPEVAPETKRLFACDVSVAGLGKQPAVGQ